MAANGWKAERDGSIRPENTSRKGCEFVSPILKGAEGVRQIENAIDQINARGGRVNSSCGLHITVSWNGDAAALARLISLVGNHERAIYASTGTRKREQMMYAKRIKQYGNKDNAKSRCESDRYHLLNLTHLTRGKNRIEFRAFGGTLNKTKVVGYLMMVLGLVELALNTKRCSEWDYIKKEGTKSCWDRPGAGLGETELNRLFSDSDGPKVGTRVPFAIRSTERSPAKPNRNGRRSKPNSSSSPANTTARPKPLPHRTPRTESRRSSAGRNTCALSRSSHYMRPSTQDPTDAIHANVVRHAAGEKAAKNILKICGIRLEVNQTAWLMCVIT